jgi:hypothetical protein
VGDAAEGADGVGAVDPELDLGLGAGGVGEADVHGGEADEGVGPAGGGLAFFEPDPADDGAVFDDVVDVIAREVVDRTAILFKAIKPKGIGNGFPLAGVLISPEFKPVYGMLGTTFGGNHLACAAAIAVLDIMENEKLLDNAKTIGDYLIDELAKLPGIKEIRGRGLMIGIEFEGSIKEIRSRLLFEEKVFTGVAGTNTIRLLPPLCLTLEEAKDFMQRFKRVLGLQNN